MYMHFQGVSIDHNINDHHDHDDHHHVTWMDVYRKICGISRNHSSRSSIAAVVVIYIAAGANLKKILDCTIFILPKPSHYV